ncbi:hypothetical protein FACS189485_09400 [Spirochaetia bacterium]|nr:hypothetical protein FACS189485_09400 [Spirochaetia bacterium]
MEKKYMYKGQDITLDILFKEEHILSIIAEKDGKKFDDSYDDFLQSKTYGALQNTASLMWTESAEFIADEYYREKSAAN